MLKIKFKKILPFLFLVFLIFLFSKFVLAQEKELEVKYPEIGGWRPTVIKEITEKEFAEYIKYIFNIAIFISGLVAFGVIIYGGVRYLTSAGSPAAIKDAKSYITGGILGLIFLFSSYLILTTINPQLVILRIEKPEFEEIKYDKPGVYLFANNEWRFYGISLDDLGDFSDKVEKIKIVNPETGDYEIRAILHEDPGYRGQCRIFIRTPEEGMNVQGKDTNGKVDNPSSLTVFRRVLKFYNYVKICPKPNLEEAEDCPCYKYPGIYSPQDLPEKINNKVWSIEIAGNFLVVLFENKKGPDFPGMCAVFFSSVSDLKKDPMNKCDPEWSTGFYYAIYKSCASAIAIYPVIGEVYGGGGGGSW